MIDWDGNRQMGGEEDRRIGREEERRKRTEDRWEGMRKGSGGEEKKGRGMIGKGRKRR